MQQEERGANYYTLLLKPQDHTEDINAQALQNNFGALGASGHLSLDGPGLGPSQFHPEPTRTECAPTKQHEQRFHAPL